MKHYTVLKSCFAGGARRSAGDVVQLTDSEGNALTNMGRVVASEAPPAKQEPVNRSVDLPVSDAPQVAKRIIKKVKK